MSDSGVLEPLNRLHSESRRLAEHAIKAIEEVEPPVTLRQLYYALVSRGYISNSGPSYRKILKLVSRLRYRGVIPYRWIIDRSRQPINTSTWTDTGDFLETVRSAYRKYLWQGQSDYVEIWLEKDALSGVFSAMTHEYQVRLMVERGFSSISFLYEAAMDLMGISKPVYVYFFGDHDPSGRNIEAKTLEALRLHGVQVRKFERIAIRPEDIDEYDLPPIPAKETDPRHRQFIKQYGHDAVELDALPPDILRQRIRDCIMRHIDLEEWKRLQVIEQEEQNSLAEFIGQLSTG